MTIGLRILPRSTDMADAFMQFELDRILIVRLSALGDVVDVLPMLHALRRQLPNARIDWIVDSGAAAIIRHHPALDHCIVAPRKHWGRWVCSKGLLPNRTCSDIAHCVRAADYTCVLDVHGNFKSAMTAQLAQARVLGLPKAHCREFNHMFSDAHSVIAGDRCHRIERALSVLDVLGLSGEFERPPWARRDEAVLEVERGLADRQLSTKQFVVLNPGTSEAGRHKRWPVARWSLLADRLMESGETVLWLYGPGEQQLLEDIRSAMRRHAPGWCPALHALPELIRHCRAFVGCDTGPTHVAMMLDVPHVGIYGPTDPRVYGPYRNTRAVAVWKEEPASAAVRSKDASLMHKIDVQDVFDAVQGVLRG